tara:strand:- start:967 stop:1158 length:192 start_codon:yes stop_codon:yes gene_type:complete
MKRYSSWRFGTLYFTYSLAFIAGHINAISRSITGFTAHFTLIFQVLAPRYDFFMNFAHSNPPH